MSKGILRYISEKTCLGSVTSLILVKDLISVLQFDMQEEKYTEALA